ncbi:ATP-dependent nuclease [Priestia megaterium]|uniref:ATP-dependent nuclease n=1 Tax=Priestia megaterium TaxID=1404 RepID=UPI000BF6C65C|nr:AAA family ATPase [Priestia megaterium]PFQ79724.1 hypothetical protein COK11_20900 [Priestia megaterium]
MKIVSVNLKDYKSIKNSGNLTLNDKVNIFAGKNNTGKTALIEALYNISNGNLVDILETKIKPETFIELEILVNEEEVEFLNSNMNPEYLIKGIYQFRISISVRKLNDHEPSASCIDRIEGYVQNEYKLVYDNNTKRENLKPHPYYYFNNWFGNQTNFQGRPRGINNFFSLFQQSMVFISGTRHVPKNQSTKLSNSLTIDGNNLNTFLYTLHNNEEVLFDKIVNVFKQIFSDVTAIGTPIDEEGLTYISLKFEGNEELIPLYNCGSGFTHVLILLCVLFTKRNSVILFDEPHVFLHPSAEKAIYDVIDETNYHQYLLTTHSPILINYSFEKNIFLVDKEDGASRFTELENIQEVLTNIGVSNSDFALSDKVLFVEGETEEAIIPRILSHFGMKQIGYNYRVLKMGGTGNDFTVHKAMTRNNDKLQLILGSISESPIPYKIIIDMDEKTDDKLDILRSKYGDSIIILDRREVENYFLDCYEELTEVINKNVGSEITTQTEVEDLIDGMLSQIDDHQLYPRTKAEPLKNVIGSRVLERLFSNYNLRFSKVRHGIQITTLVLQKHPEKLLFFKEQLEGFINGEKVEIKEKDVQTIK